MNHRIPIVASLVITLAIPLRAQEMPVTPPTAPAAPVELPNDPDRTSVARTELSRRVDFSIRRGVKYLISRQNPDGGWTYAGDPNLSDGYTALVTLALLSCGESHQSPTLSRAIAYLKRSRPERTRRGTYSVALRAAVYSLLPEPMRREELRNDLRWLQNEMIKSGPSRGMYDYGLESERADFSNSQYGVLGVWYAAMSGLEVPANYWRQVETGWLQGQNPDGGWGYRADSQASYASMTSAAIATLYITHDYLHASRSRELRTPPRNEPLEKAMAWLGANFSVSSNAGRSSGRVGRGIQDIFDLLGEEAPDAGWFIHYMLFGYERVGEATGLTRFGRYPWYDLGAEYLIRTQHYDGYWLGSIGTEGDSAYALLFLSRGRAPVAVQKLQFDGRWDNRARDAAAFVRFMRRATERHVNWQIVSIDDPLPLLREAPILYAASDRALPFNAIQKRKIESYIEQGGLLLCVNEGPGAAFAQSVEALGKELFPQYTFRDLPADHIIYTANFPSNPQNEPIRALSNGVRELIVLYPSGDMSWRWVSENGGFNPRTSAYATLANTWLYATDRANPRFKGEDSWIERNEGVVAQRTAAVARLGHESNWDPEPGGWVRLSNVMHNYDQFSIQLDVIGMQNPSGAAPATQPAALDAQRHVVAHLTATESLRLSPEMKQSLKKYLDAGGMLVMDAAGGSAEAGGSFDLLLRELYPDCLFGNMKLDHPIYHATPYGGQIINEVSYRRSTSLVSTKLPRLRGAVINRTKLVAILSNEDLSGGLVGYSTAGLNGYTPTSAMDIMRNIILWRSSALR